MTYSFEIEVPEKLVKLWLSETCDQIISQLEMFSMVCVRLKYTSRPHNRVGAFLGLTMNLPNFKYACINGASTSHSMQVLCRVLQQVEVESPSPVWYERVSSHSHPGAIPSRSQNERASKLFSAYAESKWVYTSFKSRGCTHHAS